MEQGSPGLHKPSAGGEDVRHVRRGRSGRPADPAAQPLYPGPREGGALSASYRPKMRRTGCAFVAMSRFRRRQGWRRNLRPARWPRTWRCLGSEPGRAAVEDGENYSAAVAWAA